MDTSLIELKNNTELFPPKQKYTKTEFTVTPNSAGFFFGAVPNNFEGTAIGRIEGRILYGKRGRMDNVLEIKKKTYFQFVNRRAIGMTARNDEILLRGSPATRRTSKRAASGDCSETRTRPILRQMLLRNPNVRPADRPLQDQPKRLDVVNVIDAAHILFRPVFDRAMAVAHLRECPVGHVFVGADMRSRFDGRST